MNFNIDNIELSLPIFFVMIVKAPHCRGVTNMNRYPKKLSELGVSVERSPPVTNRNAPIVAIIKPNIFSLFSFSSKTHNARIAIMTGDNKHTKSAGRDGPIKLTAPYNV